MQIFIIVGSEADGQTDLPSTAAEQAEMVTALQQAIAANPISDSSPDSIKVIQADAIPTAIADLQNQVILCPLTLNLPESLQLPDWPYWSIYRVCRDRSGLRHWVEQNLHLPAADGEFWLPIVLTVRGPLYGEVIGRTAFTDTPEEIADHYLQPVHLPDHWRQPVYRLGQQLLHELAAPPATYLLQFGLVNQKLCFDRLLPFPAVPAIASLGIQNPDLFTCHWRCLTGKPILDLVISTPVAYQLLGQ